MGAAPARAGADAVTIVAGGGALTNVLSRLPGLHQPPASGGRSSIASIQRAIRQTVLINAFVVTAQWEVVADRAPARGSTAAHDALFSCARAWYAFPSAHAVYSAAILLNAQNPARTAPNLPGLTPSTHPGDYEEASSAGGQVTATRVGNAWLLVQGPNQRQRTALLNTINIAGTAIHR